MYQIYTIKTFQNTLVMPFLNKYYIIEVVQDAKGPMPYLWLSPVTNHHITPDPIRAGRPLTGLRRTPALLPPTAVLWMSSEVEVLFSKQEKKSKQGAITRPMGRAWQPVVSCSISSESWTKLIYTRLLFSATAEITSPNIVVFCMLITTPVTS